jgi:hypothetical protein
MDLVFSWFADSGAWPEHPGTGCAVVDQEVVGPLRLLDHVETMLGLGRPEVAAVRRIAMYRRKIEAAGAGRFWSQSFEVDSWSATRELLAWRDELIEAGWGPNVGLARSRLADLAAAETAGPDLPAARADRLRAAIDALGQAPRLPLHSLALVDARAVLPGGWRALLDALELHGTRIEELPAPTPRSVNHAGQGRVRRLEGALQWSVGLVNLMLEAQAEAALAQARLLLGGRLHRVNFYPLPVAFLSTTQAKKQLPLWQILDAKK